MESPLSTRYLPSFLDCFCLHLPFLASTLAFALELTPANVLVSRPLGLEVRLEIGPRSLRSRGISEPSSSIFMF